MKTNTRRNFSGVFTAEDLGKNNWRLTSDEPASVAVYLHGAEPLAASVHKRRYENIGIEWRQASALVSMTTGDVVHYVETQSAIVHEPLERLYEGLPLAQFDARAQRFWRRVFRVVTLPGGRHLLRLFARSQRR